MGDRPARPAPVLQYLNDASRTNPEMVARFNQEPKSPGKFTMLKQVQAQAGKLLCGSGWVMRQGDRRSQCGSGRD